MPKTSSEDKLKKITQDLITVLKNHPKTPFLDQGDKSMILSTNFKTYSNHLNEMIQVKQHHLQGCK